MCVCGNFYPMNMYFKIEEVNNKINTKRDHKISAVRTNIFFFHSGVWEDKMSSSTMNIMLIHTYRCELLAECMLVQQSSVEEVFNNNNKKFNLSQYILFFL